MSAPALLPDDAILLAARDFEGLSLEQIAERYKVTIQSVSMRFTKMGRPFRPSMPAYREFVPWQIRKEHQALDATLRLRSHIKAQLDLPIPESAARRLENWHARLRSEGVVLMYRPDTDSQPWHYVPREESDGALIIRWPEDMPPPTERQRSILALPALP